MKFKRIISAVCSATLVLSLVPTGAFARRDDTVAVDTTEELIQKLLSAGDYVDGEAIVVLRAGEEPDAAGDVNQLADVSADAVDLAALTGAGVEEAVGDEVALRVQSSDADGYDIKQVVDHDRSTEDILRDLLDDPDVVSAEPNYIVASPLAFGDDTEGANTEAEQDTIETDETPSGDDARPADSDQNSEDESAPDAAEETLPDTEAQGGDEDNNTASQSDEPAIEQPEQAQLEPQLSAQAAVNPGDLTPYQWSLDDAQSTFATPLSRTTGYSINVPGWLEGRSNASAPNNASGTVCIMDTGFDTTNPDLQGVLYDFQANMSAERYAYLKATYGLGRYGLNASGDGDKGDVTAYNVHGSHVAGIVASQWNGFGTSGVANGTKIFALRNFGNNGDSQTTSEIIKGFRFLTVIARETNLKAVNCSWGTGTSQFSIEAIVNELGKKGVNTVFASGNRYCDLDETIDNGGMSTSPYSITVNAVSANGKITDFSCWGQTSTDVFAPGAQILSTTSEQIDMWSDSKTLDSRFIYKRFYPEATAPENLITFERFEGTPGVRFFAENPATKADAAEITPTVDSSLGYDDSVSVSIKIAGLNKEERALGHFRGTNGYVYLAIPVLSVADAKFISLHAAMSDGFKAAGQISAITCTGESGSPIEVITMPASALKKGWNGGNNYSNYLCQWSPHTFNIDGYIQASNEAHDIIVAGGTIGEATQDGKPSYTDPGKATGVYGWQNSGKTYVIVKYALGEVEPQAPAATSDTALYIDNVAVGKAGSYVEGYEVMSGTSMAAPTVTGCLAVIAKDEPSSSELSDSELELEARERAAKLLASVDYDDDLAGMCRTGGRVNLHHQSTFSKKAPLITRATSSGQVLTVQGCFFGDSGTLMVDGQEVVPTSWGDDRITASLDDLGLDNGARVVRIVNPDEAVMQALFSYSNDSAGKRPLYERNHSVLVNNADFIATNSDHLYGPLVYADGSLYALSVESGTCDAKALWRYDITADTWTNVGLPSGYVVNSGSDYGANTVSKTCFFALKGKIYLTGVDKSTGEDDHCIWCYDQATATWQQVKAKGIAGKWPSGNPIVIDDNLFFYAVNGTFYNFDGETPKSEPKDEADGLEGQAYVSQEEGEKITFCFALLDLEKGTATRVAAPIEDSFPNIDYNDSTMAVSGGSYGYLCARNSAKRGECYLMRLSYDAANKKVNIQDLTPAFKQATGDELLPVFERPLGAKDAIENHFTIAGLPDGVAIIGSSALGEDTHIIKEDSTEAVAYDKTSCYHKVFLPMATWGDGYLYALGESDTEPDVMYLRSTKYDAPEKREDPEPTPTPTPEPTPTPTPTPSDSSQRQTGGSGTSGTSSKQSQVSRKVLPKTGDVSTAASGALALMGLGICVFARRMRRRAE